MAGRARVTALVTIDDGCSMKFKSVSGGEELEIEIGLESTFHTNGANILIGKDEAKILVAGVRKWLRSDKKR